MVILYIFGIIWSILSIILFFKIWGACNNIADIKERLENNFKTKAEDWSEASNINSTTPSQSTADSKFKVGDVVIYPPMQRVMTIKSITVQGIECFSINKKGREEFEGVYNEEQIEPYKAE